MPILYAKLMKVSVSFMASLNYVEVGRLSLRDAAITDVQKIKDKLRFNDARECFIFGVTPEEALSEPFEDPFAKTYSICLDDEPIAMCGTVPTEHNNGSVWMLGTQDINNNKISFLKGCKEVVNLLQGNFEVIGNIVPLDHAETINWLGWCGFQFHEEFHSFNGHLMLAFSRYAKQKNNVINLYTRPVTH